MNQRRLSGVVWPLFRRILDPYHQYEPSNPPKNDLKRPSEIHPPSMPYTLLVPIQSLWMGTGYTLAVSEVRPIMESSQL